MNDTLQAMTDDRLVFDRPPLRAKRCRHGMMLYLATDQYVGGSLDRYGEFSEAEAALFAQIVKPGMTVLDLGANMGAHTICFAQAVGAGGRVIAFEPQRIIHQILCANVMLNVLPNVFAHQACIGCQAGTVLVPPLNYGAVNNFGGLALGAFTAGESVPQVTLDSLAFDQCHFVKIDVEGMEVEALEGGRATLARHRPVLYVENDRPEKSAALITLLFDLGYRLYWHLPPLFNPANFFGAQENVFGNTVSVNMIGVPNSTNIALTGFREITSPADQWRA
ncbi:MAG TPA: FkbM family methyltransferase [Stellaceae bacterium]|nr:FkbM family methyltransferase [Stellaceae bacterium]